MYGESEIDRQMNQNYRFGQKERKKKESKKERKIAE
jgi:hypothetical protein